MRQDVKDQSEKGVEEQQAAARNPPKRKSNGKTRKDEVVYPTDAISPVGGNRREPARYARIVCGLSPAKWRDGDRWPS
jgi:hypothetical protein